MNEREFHPGRLVLTYQEAAELLGVSPRSVWTLVNTGALPAARIGRSVRIPRTELEKYLATRVKESLRSAA
jgi:excisionase family DNA binding protein